MKRCYEKTAPDAGSEHTGVSPCRRLLYSVIPAQAGIQGSSVLR